MNNMNQMMKQVKKMQEQMLKAQEILRQNSRRYFWWRRSYG